MQRRWRTAVIAALRALAALLFVVAGTLHFIRPAAFEGVVPEQLPNPAALVAISGAAEILGGVGLLVPRTRRVAGWGLVALLVAVFPANVNMALHPQAAGRGFPEWALWARLPLQAVLVGWVLVVSRRRA
jgi:uncharacterized membrane protein